MSLTLDMSEANANDPLQTFATTTSMSASDPKATFGWATCPNRGGKSARCRGLPAGVSLSRTAIARIVSDGASSSRCTDIAHCMEEPP